MKLTTVTCDHCLIKFNTDSHSEDWYLVVKNERISAEEDELEEFPLDLRPILDEDKYFCSIACLGVWSYLYNKGTGKYENTIKK